MSVDHGSDEEAMSMATPRPAGPTAIVGRVRGGSERVVVPMTGTCAAAGSCCGLVATGWPIRHLPPRGRGRLAIVLPLLSDFADRAAAAVDPLWHDYIETGSGEEITLAAAPAAWRDFRFRPRVLRPATGMSTAVELFGTTFPNPVGVAPTGYHRVLHDQGEVATAAGAKAAGSLLVVSTRATMPLAQIAAAAGPWWMQIYLTQERAVISGLVAQAADLGAQALVLTGDTPVVPARKRGQASRLVVDPDWQMVNTRQHVPAGADPQAAIAQDPAASLADIERLAQRSGLPVLVKGVLRGDDAQACLDAGAAGIVVSNHGGRQLDRAVATAHALGEVVDAIAGRVPVLVDGGIRSGTDALVALALGADAVLLGRPVMWGLAADGADGVQAVLDAVTADLREAMVLLGAAGTAELDSSCVAPQQTRHSNPGIGR